MQHLVEWLERLTGERQPQDARPPLPDSHPFKDSGIGYSQFNELLLSLGYDRVSSGFFKFVFGDDESIDTFTAFRSGVEKFRKKAMLKYGNFKYAYKQYAKSTFEELTEAFKELEAKPVSAFRRHRSLVKVQRIKRTETPYLGYLVRKRVLSDLENAKSEVERKSAEKQKQRMDAAEKRGLANHDLYLTYDHLDVYVATSMRRPFDFWNVSRFVTELFSSPLLKELHPRWFDPTQAYCRDRLDKGLVEGLMLKRAACTIYLAQESETLGKDSELTTTLAQGKTVIAYVPRLRDFDQFKAFAREVREELYPDRDPQVLLLEFLEIFYPQGAWRDAKVRGWLDNPSSINLDEALQFIFDKANEMYDNKAQSLLSDHPLGLQIDLERGVANGVLVVRSVAMCAKVLRMVLTRTLEFDVEETEAAYLLRERITQSIVRVVTKDQHLTNAFWNFYPGVGPSAG